MPPPTTTTTPMMGRGRNRAFTPRVSASKSGGAGKDRRRGKGVAEGGETVETGGGGGGGDGDDAALPSDLQRLVREHRAASGKASGSRTQGGTMSGVGRGMRTAEIGDSARVAIGAGAGAGRKAAEKAEKEMATVAARAVVEKAAASAAVFPSSKVTVKSEPMDTGDADVEERDPKVPAESDVVVSPPPPTARPARMSRSKQAQLALEEASRKIQPGRANTSEMFDAEDDWVDKTQYYPTVLTASSREVVTGTVGETMREAAEDTFIVFQLPSDLPLRKRNDIDEMDVDSVVEIPDDDESSAVSGMVRRISDLSDGQLGEIKIYADGTAKFFIGNAIFDVMQGTPYQHSEHLAHLDGENQQCVILGPSTTRMTCIPDVTQLLL